jgi:hypothetical protein
MTLRQLIDRLNQVAKDYPQALDNLVFLRYRKGPRTVLRFPVRYVYGGTMTVGNVRMTELVAPDYAKVIRTS